jgi:dihydrofolate synthase/folylpolyglutamate synthase
VVDAAAVPNELGLPGAHQRKNAATALGVMDALAQLRRAPWPPGVLEGGLAAARFPGRLERIGDALLDGAHNPAGARAFVTALSDLGIGRPRHLVIGVSRDKNLPAMAQVLAPAVDRVFASAAKSERATDPRMIAQAFLDVRPDLPVGVVEPVPSALQAAAGGQVLVCGSLFVVGEARAALLGQRSEEMTISDPMP